jgi:hypothetical protein
MEVAERNNPQNGAPGKPREPAASRGNPPERPGHLGERTTLLRFGRRCAALRRSWPASQRRGAQHGDLSATFSLAPSAPPPGAVSAALAAQLAATAAELAACTTRPWTLMEVCGGQTHAILR